MIHPTAEVDPRAQISANAKIWHYCQIRQDARIGNECILGKGVYVDFGVQIGNQCKLQNGVKVYHGATLEDGVFMGPQSCILNDKNPRAITPDGALKSDADWEVGLVLIRRGASIGAGALILPNVTVGEFALVGSGAVVTRNVPNRGLVVGNPARLIGYVCDCGRRLTERVMDGKRELICAHDSWIFEFDANENLVRQA